VLDELVNGESSVVRLNNGIGHLGRGDDGESGHHTVGELLTDLGDKECTHTGTSTTTKRVSDLETLEAVTSLSLATDDIDNLVDKLGTLSVVTLGPVVTSTGLTENKVVGTEELTKGTSADGVHGTGLQVDEDGTGNVFVAGGLHQYELCSVIQWIGSTHLVEVNVHTLQLEVGRAIVAVDYQILSDCSCIRIV
jgi:hypothetical protein